MKNILLMKAKIIIFAFLLFSKSLMAQYTVVQPECFTLTSIPGSTCPTDYIGNIYFNTTENKVMYCSNNGTSIAPNEYWAANGSDIYYLGKIGLFNINPTYDLDMGAATRTQNLIVNGNFGLNTTTPSEKFEVKDRDVAISSTADVYNWRIRNTDASDRLEVIDNGQRIMNVNYGGNISIGQNLNINTHKLYVDGNVSYANSLSVEGKGTLSNTSATQLVMATVSSIATPSSFFVTNNGCETALINFPVNTFTAPPAVFLGQNLSSPQLGETLTKTIINITATTGQIRFCNNTGASINISNQTFSIIAIGQ